MLHGKGPRALFELAVEQLGADVGVKADLHAVFLGQAHRLHNGFPHGGAAGDGATHDVEIPGAFDGRFVHVRRAKLPAGRMGKMEDELPLPIGKIGDKGSAGGVVRGLDHVGNIPPIPSQAG